MRLPHPLLLWFAVLGAPLAWALQHIVGYALTEVRCDEQGTRLHLDAWTIAVTTVALAIGALAAASAIAIYRSTRDAGKEPPGSRVHFLALLGITVAPLFLCLILMSGLGVVVLVDCRQG